ncbi:hypothetical protein KR96_08195 [Ralstonia solanacearum]|nr:hypothetical protein KR96_08195 [Ralstonia solanacearum]
MRQLDRGHAVHQHFIALERPRNRFEASVSRKARIVDEYIDDGAGRFEKMPHPGHGVSCAQVNRQEICIAGVVASQFSGQIVQLVARACNQQKFRATSG